MKIASILRVWGMAFSIILLLSPIEVFVWGDNYVDPETGEKGRPSYTTEEIKNGAIGATKLSDGDDYKNSPNYPGQIIFNTISDSTIGDEKNFVSARRVNIREDGLAEDATPETQWRGNNITVTDGAYYAIRLYAHNNNRSGHDAVAENTRVSFIIPNGTSKQIRVNGSIKSSNAIPSEYFDSVSFDSEVPFHLDYVYGSALLNNNKTQDEAASGGYLYNAGWKLSDDIVKAASVDGVLIGSDALDGRVPGGYEYANYVTIVVRAVFDYEYTVEQKVRLAGSDDNWEDAIEARVGDKVEFRIEYKNTSDKSQEGVAIKDILPSNLEYIAGSSTIKNSNHSAGAKILQDSLVSNGIRIGDYSQEANAYIHFQAEVVDDDLEAGVNTLTNWSQAGVGLKTIQDHASVIVYKNAAWFPIVTTILVVLIVLCFIIIIVLLLYKWKIKKI